MVYHDECRNCKCCVVAGSGELYIQDVVETDVVGHHGRKGIFFASRGHFSVIQIVVCMMFPVLFFV
jgi:hypothetical protein